MNVKKKFRKASCGSKIERKHKNVKENLHVFGATGDG
jgi:hypothetical protein